MNFVISVETKTQIRFAGPACIIQSGGVKRVAVLARSYALAVQLVRRRYPGCTVLGGRCRC